MFYQKIFLTGVIIMTTLSGIGHSQQSTGKIYYKGEYPQSHWALETYELNNPDDPKVVAIAYYKDHEYTVYLNPSK